MNDGYEVGLSSRMREVYDANAVVYADSTKYLTMFPGLREELRRFSGVLQPRTAVLDLGCGGGRDVEYLTRAGLWVVAADISACLLRTTATRCGRIALVQMDMLALPFRDDSFGGVWACASLVHVERRTHPSVLREVLRVLKPGGRVAISMKAGVSEGWTTGKRIADPRWFTEVVPDVFIDQLRSVGFCEVVVLSSGRDAWYVAEGVKPPLLDSTSPDHNREGPA